MKLTLKFSILLLMWICFISGISCQKQNKPLKPNAVILNFYPSALGGCDYVIQMNDTHAIYSPVNLGDEYKKDSLKVSVSYHILNTKRMCGGLLNSGYTHLYVDDITVTEDQ